MLSSRARALAAAGVIAAGVLLGLAVTEIGLRLAGFEYRPFPIVQFGWPDPKAISEGYESDPELLWVTRDYHQVLQAGHRERPAVVFMGDSCTQFGTYPSKTLAVLAVQRPQLSHGVKVGVGGWTVVQGNWQLARDVLPMHPRVVTIYYGWNDHWIALGPTDPQLERVRPWLQLAEHFRLAQAGLKVWVGGSNRRGDKPPRVSPERYLSNLETIAHEARDAGIVPILVTAPSNHVPGREPEYLQIRHVNRLSDVVPLHAQYVDLTRQAAKEGHAVLCDAFAALKAPPDTATLFRNDGIHFTDAGDAVLGQVVGQCLAPALQRRS